MARRRRKKQGSGLKIFLTIFAVLLLLIMAASTFGYFYVTGDINGNRGGDVVNATITIEQGAGVLTIGNILQDAGIIRHGQIFRYYAPQNEKTSTMQYGDFDVSSDMSYDEIIDVLQRTFDDRETVSVTFPEGISVFRFGSLMEEAGLCTADEFIDVANNGDFSQFKFWNERTIHENAFMACEGFLFPETYEFFVGDDVYNMVEKIYAEFDKRFTDEMYTQVEEMGFTLSEFITLASIVQEEAGPVEQQSNVAAIFMARLTPNNEVEMLQSNCASHFQNDEDNNYIYNYMAPYFGGWDSIPQEMFNSYNTYELIGLPAGPISNPGMDAIQNTLNYQTSEYYTPEDPYYYFLTDFTGKYYYERTYSAHLVNVDIMHEVNASFE